MLFRSVFKANDLGYVEKIFADSLSNSTALIDAEGSYLRDYVALAECLPHVRGELIQNLEGGDFVLLVIVVSQFQSQVHNMVVLFLLHDVPDFGQSLDRFISHLLPRVVEHFIQQREYGPHCLIIPFLAVLLSDKGY